MGLTKTLRRMSRILIAEDDAFLRDLTGILLRKQGYEVLSARDGEEALETARAEIPDLVLMDVNMPHLSGFDVARHLREDEATAKIPIIFLTAHNQEQQVSEGMAYGRARYLTKPFDNKALLALIAETLQEVRS